MVNIEIFECSLSDSSFKKDMISANTIAVGGRRLLDWLHTREPSLVKKYKAAVNRVKRKKSLGIKIFYSPSKGIRKYLFIRWYYVCHDMIDEFLEV